MDMNDSTSGYLNPTGCVIKTRKSKGRGVYASQFIPRNTVIEISPVLLFYDRNEYETHGSHAILDHYTFKWTDGRMAFARGLGSLFNHSDQPNTTYILDPQTDCIRYIAARDIQADEELCIFYGHSFTPAIMENEDFTHQGDGISTTPSTLGDEDGWDDLFALDNREITNPYLQGDPNEIIAEEALPFTKLKPTPDEEDLRSIRTIDAWVVDIPDARHIATLLKWLKEAGLDTPDLHHLKRIRKRNNFITLLICNTVTSLEPPLLPSISNLDQAPLPTPYLIPVPALSALTLTSLALKSAIWPTIYAPRRKDEREPWTRGKLRWAWDAMKWTVDAAMKAAEEHQHPIAAYVPPPYDPLLNSSDNGSISFTASDSRKTTKNPLRHSILNVIRKVADHHNTTILSPSTEFSPTATETPKNGTNYLLTDRNVFVTHEPCIMCSMALLHSRVKEVMYLYPMSQTGGCGGCARLPSLKGINHRFEILRWKLPVGGVCPKNPRIKIDDTVDA